MINININEDGFTMKTEFTKGPWVSDEVDLPITESSVFNILSADGGEGCIADVYISEDAFLIASAPDMYKELERVYKLLNELNGVVIHNLGFDGVHESINNLLTKARGEQS